MANVTETKEFFQAVLESLLWCPSVAMACGELTAQHDPGQVMIPHPEDIYLIGILETILFFVNYSY